MQPSVLRSGHFAKSAASALGFAAARAVIRLGLERTRGVWLAAFGARLAGGIHVERLRPLALKRQRRGLEIGFLLLGVGHLLGQPLIAWVWKHNACFLDQFFAELIFQDTAFHFNELALFQVAQHKWAKREANKAVYLQFEGAQHLFHFAVLALFEAKSEPDVIALHLVDLAVNGAVRHAFHGDAF